MSKNPVVGVAGCGSTGLPMAQALQHAGYEVWGLDVRPVSEFGSFQSRHASRTCSRRSVAPVIDTWVYAGDRDSMYSRTDTLVCRRLRLPLHRQKLEVYRPASGQLKAITGPF